MAEENVLVDKHVVHSGKTGGTSFVEETFTEKDDIFTENVLVDKHVLHSDKTGGTSFVEETEKDDIFTEKDDNCITQNVCNYDTSDVEGILSSLIKTSQIVSGNELVISQICNSENRKINIIVLLPQVITLSSEEITNNTNIAFRQCICILCKQFGIPVFKLKHFDCVIEHSLSLYEKPICLLDISNKNLIRLNNALYPFMHKVIPDLSSVCKVYCL